MNILNTIILLLVSACSKQNLPVGSWIDRFGDWLAFNHFILNNKGSKL